MKKQCHSIASAIVVGMIMTLLLAGCATTASLTQISAFGTAASSLADDSQKAFKLIDTTTIDRKMYDIAASPSLGPTDATFEGLFNEPNFEKLQIRIAVLDKLGSYAKALQQLATADFRKEVDSAAADLYASLSGLGANFKKATGQDLPLKDDQLKIIATAVDAIGSAVVEIKRRDAIKAVIIQANEAVQKAADLVASDLGKDSELSKLIHENIANAELSLKKAYNIARTSTNYGFNIRYEMLVRIKQLHDSAEASPKLCDSISTGAKKVAETHSALKSAVTKDQFASSEIAKEIGELVEYAKSVRSFYEKLGVKN